MNDDWYTGQYVDSKSGESHKGIFPSNYVRKFDFPIDCITKNNLAIVVQDHFAANNEELMARSHDIIAISHMSPDQLWTFAEIYVKKFNFKVFH